MNSFADLHRFLRPLPVSLSKRADIAFSDYNRRMARGWESKSVEDQIGAAEAAKEMRAKRALTDQQLEQLKRKEGLLLERARIIREMERAYMRRHLTMLERGLAHIESELAKLEPNDN